MSTDNDESRSWRDRGKKAVSRATRPLSSATDAVTGREVERQVAEYSETFTQVVLGLHEDLTSASRRIAALEMTVSELRERANEPQAATPRPGTYAFLLGAALLLAIVALGVSVWALG